VLKQLEDETLMQLIQTGRPEAFGILFMRYQRLVFSVANRILRDSAEAEDLSQDVFIEMYQKANLYDPRRGSVKTWVLQYAYHRSLNRRKYLLVRKSYAACASAALEPAGCCRNEWWDRLIRTWDCGKVVLRGLQDLTDKERVVIEWVSFEGLTLREASARMATSYDNARNHYYRGLKKLKKVAVARTDTA
jgi:RNA polymerase sigma-70 factor (ECF subfamily)